ncbi:MAG: cohesin domain-containing protein [Defluviitaleaceae bacterium]|nr:cohesin domain-containing protein [Defluviitaleaceae bacterium]
MKQERLALKGFIAMLAVVAVAAAMFFVISTTTVPVYAGANGTVRVTMPNFETGMDTAVTNLQAAITTAKARLAETDVATTGAGTPSSRWWAPQAVHNPLIEKIAEAEAMLTMVGSFQRGQEFDAVVTLEGNTGFAGMMLRFELPAGLELIGVTPGPLFANQNNFEAPSDWQANFSGGAWVAPFTIDPAKTGTVVIGRGGDNNITGNGTLATLRLRVTSSATTGLTNPVTLTFGHMQDDPYEVPTAVAGGSNTPLTMSIQNTTITSANVGTQVNIARINVRN